MCKLDWRDFPCDCGTYGTEAYWRPRWPDEIDRALVGYDIPQEQERSKAVGPTTLGPKQSPLHCLVHGVLTIFIVGLGIVVVRSVIDGLITLVRLFVRH